jgi:hypothetical protein
MKWLGNNVLCRFRNQNGEAIWGIHGGKDWRRGLLGCDVYVLWLGIHILEDHTETLISYPNTTRHHNPDIDSKWRSVQVARELSAFSGSWKRNPQRKLWKNFVRVTPKNLLPSAPSFHLWHKNFVQTGCCVSNPKKYDMGWSKENVLPAKCMCISVRWASYRWRRNEVA